MVGHLHKHTHRFAHIFFVSLLVDESSFDTVLGQLMPEEKTFFQFLNSQLEMVNKFYQGTEGKEKEYPRSFDPNKIMTEYRVNKINFSVV